MRKDREESTTEGVLEPEPEPKPELEPEPELEQVALVRKVLGSWASGRSTH